MALGGGPGGQGHGPGAALRPPQPGLVEDLRLPTAAQALQAELQLPTWPGDGPQEEEEGQGAGSMARSGQDRSIRPPCSSTPDFPSVFLSSAPSHWIMLYLLSTRLKSPLSNICSPFGCLQTVIKPSSNLLLGKLNSLSSFSLSLYKACFLIL